LSQPASLFLALLLLGGTAARSQAPALAQRQRTVTSNPADPPPEVRVAKGTRTLLLFPAPLRGKLVEVDPARIRVVDVGERSIVLEASSELRTDERLRLGVPLEQGRVELTLVTHPTEVDTEIVVMRPEQPRAGCEAALRELRARHGAITPAEFVRARYLDATGIVATRFQVPLGDPSGLQAENGVSYRGSDWILVEVMLLNHSGQPWTPSGATLTSTTGKPVTVRSVAAAAGEIAPGRREQIFVEAEVPPPSAGLAFTLELLGADGRRLSIPTVRLPPPGDKQ
jgi:uncharacterized protein (TIGR02268 family)